MARWKITTYLTDECGEHKTQQDCETPPSWWEDEGNDPADYDGIEEGWCYRPIPEGEIDTRAEAEAWMNCLFTYGDKHQSASFTNTTIEPVN